MEGTSSAGKNVNKTPMVKMMEVDSVPASRGIGPVSLVHVDIRSKAATGALMLERGVCTVCK